MRWLSSVCRRTTSQLLVYPHSFTRVHTSKRSAPRHCALQMCSIARNFAHQASMYVIWSAALLNLGFSASSAQHLAPSTIPPTKVLKSNEPTISLWWLFWSRSYQMIVDTRISSVPHTRQNSSEIVCGTRYGGLTFGPKAHSTPRFVKLQSKEDTLYLPLKSPDYWGVRKRVSSLQNLLDFWGRKRTNQFSILLDCLIQEQS